MASISDTTDTTTKNTKKVVTLDSLGITEEQVKTTMETLETLAKAGEPGFDLFNSRPMKRMRKAVVPFLEEMRKKFAINVDEQEKKRHLKRW